MRFGGLVVAGDGRGRHLGFPTANIARARDGVLPPDGVYACLVRFPPSTTAHGATVSIGDNPTFGDVAETRAEAYIHDLDADLYGRRIEVEVVQRLRDMERFDDLDALISGTADDVLRSRAVLAGLAVLARPARPAQPAAGVA